MPVNCVIRLSTAGIYKETQIQKRVKQKAFAPYLLPLGKVNEFLFAFYIQQYNVLIEYYITMTVGNTREF